MDMCCVKEEPKNRVGLKRKAGGLDINISFLTATCLSWESYPTWLSYLFCVCDNSGARCLEILRGNVGLMQAQHPVCLVLKSQGWINSDPKGPLRPPNVDHLSFLLTFLMFLLPGVERDGEESVSDDLKLFISILLL